MLGKRVGNVGSVALEISVGFYTIAMTLYNNVSTAGGTTDILRGFKATGHGRHTVIHQGTAAENGAADCGAPS